LTGRPPFLGETVLDTLLLVQTQEPVPPSRLRPRVPRDLEAVCLKCLRKEPPRRYADAAQLAAELRRYLAGEPLRHTRPVGRVERAWRWCRRNPALAAASGLALLGLAAAAAALALYAANKARTVEELTRAHAQTGSALTQAQDNLEQFRKAD